MPVGALVGIATEVAGEEGVDRAIVRGDVTRELEQRVGRHWMHRVDILDDVLSNTGTVEPVEQLEPPAVGEKAIEYRGPRRDLAQPQWLLLLWLNDRADNILDTIRGQRHLLDAVAGNTEFVGAVGFRVGGQRFVRRADKDQWCAAFRCLGGKLGELLEHLGVEVTLFHAVAKLVEQHQHANEALFELVARKRTGQNGQ